MTICPLNIPFVLNPIDLLYVKLFDLVYGKKSYQLLTKSSNILLSYILFKHFIITHKPKLCAKATILCFSRHSLIKYPLVKVWMHFTYQHSYARPLGSASSSSFTDFVHFCVIYDPLQKELHEQVCVCYSNFVLIDLCGEETY